MTRCVFHRDLTTRKLAEQLTKAGHPISHTAAAKPLRSLGYSLRSTRTTTGLTVRCELDPNLYPTKSNSPISRKNR